MMTNNNYDDDGSAGRPVMRRLHPRVYAAVVGLAAWLVLSIWIFAGGGMTDYLLVVVSGFILIAVALPLILSRVGRSGGATRDADQAPSYHDWAASEFDTQNGHLTGSQAATQILLPIAAVAFGMTVFGIALHIAEHSVS